MLSVFSVVKIFCILLLLYPLTTYDLRLTVFLTT